MCSMKGLSDGDKWVTGSDEYGLNMFIGRLGAFVGSAGLTASYHISVVMTGRVKLPDIEA